MFQHWWWCKCRFIKYIQIYLDNKQPACCRLCYHQELHQPLLDGGVEDVLNGHHDRKTNSWFWSLLISFYKHKNWRKNTNMVNNHKTCHFREENIIKLRLPVINMRRIYYSHISRNKVVPLLLNITITLNGCQWPPTPGPPGCASPCWSRTPPRCPSFPAMIIKSVLSIF